jgi:hypothetical protein
MDVQQRRQQVATIVLIPLSDIIDQRSFIGGALLLIQIYPWKQRRV